MSSWRTAFFKQAASEYKMFNHFLQKDDFPVCHTMHYLQMLTEKLAKGFLTPVASNRHPRTVHDAFVKFVKGIPKSHPSIYGKITRKKSQVRPYVDSILPLAKKIEELAPTLQLNRINPEYPWISGRNVICPAEYDFSELRLQSPKMSKLLRLIDSCFEAIQQELDHERRRNR